MYSEPKTVSAPLGLICDLILQIYYLWDAFVSTVNQSTKQI